MSVPEDTEILKNIEKPFLKYKIGQQVFLKTDIEKKYPMLIVGFEIGDWDCNDYFVTWMNNKGSIECDGFPEECLTPK